MPFENQVNESFSTRDRVYTRVAIFIGLSSFAVLLAYHNLADDDLWAKLSLGASVWLRGDFIRHDIFAFTPVLPKYIDHEWGAGFIWYGLLKAFGPIGLMLLKIAFGCGCLLVGATVARRNGSDWPSILVVAIPGAAALLTGYVPVIRSHAFTFFFLALTLFGLEELRKGRNWPAACIVLLILIWTNVHGGFVAGLGAIAVYTGYAIWTKQRIKIMLTVSVASLLVTFINPYGIEFWRYLIPALLHPRAEIAEWRALPLWGNDVFWGFRILTLLVAIAMLAGWKNVHNHNWPGVAMLVITIVLGWKSRRHAPFLGVTAIAFATPYFTAMFSRLAKIFLQSAERKLSPSFAVLTAYGCIGIVTAAKFLPTASLQPLAPVGYYPVREADILSLAQAKGNLAVPFSWGSYCAWRLFPNIKISMDGRYETTYPESTFQLNQNFFLKRGADWDRLVREHPVNFVILDLKRATLRPEDLSKFGYKTIWQTDGVSALLAKDPDAVALKETAEKLPPNTINPLDPAIPETWWK